MSNFYMAITFLALPYYIWRTKRILKKQDDELAYKESKKWGDDFLGVRGKKIINRNEENYINLDQCVFVSNHQSHNDIFILLKAIDRPIRFIAKKELFTSNIFRHFMKLSKSYPLDREDPRESMKVLKEVVNDLNTSNANVAVFPEGTRSRGRDILEFKAGLFSMLSRTEVPIIPTYIHNSYNSNLKTYIVSYGEPIYPKGMKGQALCDLAKDRIQTMQNELEKSGS
ncbi:MAG: 1-acyl-sn-glycerol-3-phosphate acyltransferase [Erysipelothrix sp.]|nr:1-acyl-sn-glycerol-3-phosphate acyltransferase [Erysipelothrix sp.]